MSVYIAVIDAVQTWNKKLLNINIEIEILVTENDFKNWLKLTRNIGMSGYVAFVDATQKYKKNEVIE